jgi:hypothetical protein
MKLQRLLGFFLANAGREISSLELVALGVTGYRKIVGELRKRGYRIESRRRYGAWKQEAFYIFRGKAESDERERQSAGGRASSGRPATRECPTCGRPFGIAGAGGGGAVVSGGS